MRILSSNVNPLIFKNQLLAGLICLMAIVRLSAQNHYQNAWEALDRNDRVAARQWLEQALVDPESTVEAAITLLYLDLYEEKVRPGENLFEKIQPQLDNPYPYYFVFWSYDCLFKNDRVFDTKKIALLEKLVSDPECPSTLAAEASNVLASHYLGKSDFSRYAQVLTGLSNVNNWQFAGLFDNLMNSGFDKNYAPVDHPEPSAIFKNKQNAEVRWFEPLRNQPDGTQGNFDDYFSGSSGIVYAQSFVTAPANMDVVLGLRFGGNCKVWINDRLVFSEQEPRRNNFDTYRVKCRLKKGVNRVLVQIGFSENENPYFTIRFLDNNGQLASGLRSEARYAPYPKDKSTEPTEALPFFAETYFENKVKQDPANRSLSLLLFNCYLHNGKKEQAIALIDSLLQTAPENTLLRYCQLFALQQAGNETERRAVIETIKSKDPDLLISIRLLFDEAVNQKRFDDAAQLLQKWESRNGEGPEFSEKRIKLLLEQNKMEASVQAVEKAWKQYPNWFTFAQYQYNVEHNVRKNPEAALAVLKQYFERNFSMNMAFKYANVCFEKGKTEEGLSTLKLLETVFPNDPSIPNRLFEHYFAQKEHEPAKKYITELLAFMPYQSIAFIKAAKLDEQMGNEKAALQHYEKALYFNPNDFDTRERIRDLKKLPHLSELFPKDDPYQRFRESDPTDKDNENGYYCVEFTENTILHRDGTSEEKCIWLVKITNDAGINAYKETSLSYDEDKQELIIEKAEAIKPNGVKIQAERDGNQLVFPNLQVGDGVHIQYNIRSYALGRLAQEHNGVRNIQLQIPVDKSSLNILVEKSIPLNFQTRNISIKPIVTTHGDYTLYRWDFAQEKAVPVEDNAPALVDVGKFIQYSTMKDWEKIIEWYADISALQAKRDHDVQQLAKTLFPEKTPCTETEKARRIYEWIIKNIRYSSVSFRQSGLVPQRASKVIQTKLGDCKDLATLYVALARELGLKANLVLLDTREQGNAQHMLPSFEFNHCIVKCIADGQAFYLELTDENLPFAALQVADCQANALEIPFGDAAGSIPGLVKLNPANRKKDYLSANVQVEIDNTDLNIRVQKIASGIFASGDRGKFRNLDQKRQVEEIQKNISYGFKNPVAVKSLRFGNLAGLQDTTQSEITYSIRNEVVEIGSMLSFKVPFQWVFVNGETFEDESRELPFCYWMYESSEGFREEINIKIPAGKKLLEVPSDVQLNFKETRYQLTYQQIDSQTLRVVRDIAICRDKDIAPEDFPEMRAFVGTVLRAEGRMLALQ